MVIIDCGANVGDMTSRFARTGATVHAFEPNPLCYSIIKRRFARMNKVTCHNKGVMSRQCKLSLSTPEPHGGFDSVGVTVSSSFVHDDFGVPASAVEVECIDLADFIEQLGADVSLLKMDIEGAEVQVINHLLDRGVLGRVRLAIVETHERFSPELASGTEALRSRLEITGFASRVRLDWA